MTRPTKASRNDPCPCGSGKKFKKCCDGKQRDSRTSRVMVIFVLAVVAAGALAVGFGAFRDEGVATAAPGRVWSTEHGHYH